MEEKEEVSDLKTVSSWESLDKSLDNYIYIYIYSWFSLSLSLFFFMIKADQEMYDVYKHITKLKG